MDYGLWTMDCGLWTVDYGLWTVDCGLWTVDYGLWTVDCVLVLSEPGGGGCRSRQFTDDLSSANAAKACPLIFLKNSSFLNYWYVYVSILKKCLF